MPEVLPASSAIERPSPPVLGGASVDVSAVSWAAVFAGATAGAALSLILLMLGVGLGLSSLTPWQAQGAGAAAVGVSTIAWITLTQLAASGMGGYLAGRLRTRWTGTDPDEVYFRDTAHGFLAWATASLATAAFLTSAISAVLGTGLQAGGAAAGGAATNSTTLATGGAEATAGRPPGEGLAANGTMYFVDSLFRASPLAAATAASAPTGAAQVVGQGADVRSTAPEIARIFAAAAADGALSADDARHIALTVAQSTDLSPAAAERRVNETFSRMQAKAKATEEAAKEAADGARKAAAYTSLWLFISLLAGAFIASLCATYGGRQRDRI
jgi:hypothetical protein